uniref:Uncharacterized protein n=1 Tax=Rhizophora mucronata TaxID=61149 RepID=A0A2P2R0S7_RHIMU
MSEIAEKKKRTRKKEKVVLTRVRVMNKE